MANRGNKADKAIAKAKTFVYIFLWLFLYGFPESVLGARDADGPHVIFEGVTALLLLIFFLRDGPPRRDGGKPRYWLVFLVLVPMAALRRAAEGIFCQAGVSFYMPDADAAFGPGMYKWYVLRTCVTAPVMEELGCRWLVFGKARRSTGFWPAALLSAAVFSLIHIEKDPALAVAVIPGALLHCLAYELTGKLRYCVIGHMIFNVLCLPVAPWVTVEWANRLVGVPEEIGAPVLIAVTVIIILLCAFRKKLFYKNSGGSEIT